MRYYRSYMDRQEVSAGTHERLMNLRTERRAPRRPWAKYGALAACAVLIAGAGAWGLRPGPAPKPEGGPPPAAVSTPAPIESEAADRPQIDDSQGFVVHSPAEEDPVNFFYMPGISFPDITGAPQADASRAFAPGSFTAELTMEDVQKIFWGPEGVPEAYSTEIGRQDLPWALFWDGYTVQGTAWYDGQGQLTELTIWGEKGRASFTLELRLGALPFTCCVDMSRDDAVSEFNGVEITGWSQVYDRDGDGETDYICGSEFMTDSGAGVRFVSRNNGRTEDGVDGESWFNTLFVRQALTGGLCLDHLMTAEHVPAWRDERFDTLEQARQEAEFAPYLPTAEPEGYGAYSGNKEFYGHLSYQEGNQNMLFVRWTRGYDSVEVAVCLPEGESGPVETIDISRPETYDTRLYEIPWCDSVPEEYISYFLSTPVFRAEDMSLAVVEARAVPHDTGGERFEFDVLHESGAVVRYSCDGMTARQVWELVEATLQSPSGR